MLCQIALFSLGCLVLSCSVVGSPAIAVEGRTKIVASGGYERADEISKALPLQEENAEESEVEEPGDPSHGCEEAYFWAVQLSEITVPWYGGTRKYEGKLDGKLILSAVSISGFIVENINIPGQLHCSIPILEREIEAGEGRCFLWLLHLGDRIQAAVERRGSIHMRTLKRDSGCDLFVAPDWYLMKFKGFGKSSKLIELKYLFLEPECPDDGPC